MALIIPPRYKQKLLPETTEVAIKQIKETFQTELARALNLRRVTAPLFVLSGTGLNDDLNGVEHAVSFSIEDMGGARAEVVHSLAKWKRAKLAAYDIAPGYGLYTDMNAIRTFEELDNIHSLYVDQWDWEKTIRPEDRNVGYLRSTVEKIYSVIRNLEARIYEQFPHITPVLPERITFIHAEELLRLYPHLTPKEREAEAARRYGAIFIIGIGAPLSNGLPHDGRAPDYDDWSTPTYPSPQVEAPSQGGSPSTHAIGSQVGASSPPEQHTVERATHAASESSPHAPASPEEASGDTSSYLGLNGDLVVWNPVLGIPFELSSMGIRVSPESLERQLSLRGCSERATLNFHSSLLSGALPASIGGGIGQSRLCMFLLQKAHIGEVQSSIWPPAHVSALASAGIPLL